MKNSARRRRSLLLVCRPVAVRRWRRRLNKRGIAAFAMSERAYGGRSLLEDGGTYSVATCLHWLTADAVVCGRLEAAGRSDSPLRRLTGIRSVRSLRFSPPITLSNTVAHSGIPWVYALASSAVHASEGTPYGGTLKIGRAVMRGGTVAGYARIDSEAVDKRASSHSTTSRSLRRPTGGRAFASLTPAH